MPVRRTDRLKYHSRGGERHVYVTACIKNCICFSQKESPPFPNNTITTTMTKSHHHKSSKSHHKKSKSHHKHRGHNNSKKSQKGYSNDDANINNNNTEENDMTNTTTNTPFHRGFTSEKLRNSFTKSLSRCLRPDNEYLQQHRFQHLDSNLREYVAPNLVTLSLGKASQLRCLEDALQEISSSKRKVQRQRETQLLQQLNYTEVSHLTFEREARLLKTAKAGIVKLLNAVSAAKKNKLKQQQQEMQKNDGTIEGDKVYEILKQDRFNYKLPDRVTIHKQDL